MDGDEEGATMPLNITTTDTDTASPIPLDASPSDPTSKQAGESKGKGKGKKVFDCSICAQDIEVPVIMAGAEDGASATGMILQRRMYMVTPCRHIFHAGCLEGWMRYRLMCPNCREVLPPL